MKLQGTMSKLMEQVFKPIDTVVWDLSTNKTGIKAADGIYTLDDAKALAEAAKSLENLRSAYDRTAAAIDRAKQSAAPDAGDIDRLSMEMMLLEHQIGKQIGVVHAAAVNAGVADLRPARAYAPVIVKAGPFTSYTHQPARPRAMMIGGAL